MIRIPLARAVRYVGIAGVPNTSPTTVLLLLLLFFTYPMENRSALGRWANNERDFVRENRREPGAGSVCCRRREQEHAKKEAIALRSQRLV